MRRKNHVSLDENPEKRVTSSSNLMRCKNILKSMQEPLTYSSHLSTDSEKVSSNDISKGWALYY